VQAWIGLADASQAIQWIAGGTPHAMPPQFSAEVVQQVVQEAREFTFRDHTELVSGGLFPMVHEGCIIGLLALLSNQTDHFKPATIQWIRTLARVISDSLFREENGSAERQGEYSIARILQSGLDVRDTLPSVLEILAGLLQADAIVALGYDATLRRFKLLMAHGVEAPLRAKLNLYSESGLVGKSRLGTHLVWNPDLRNPWPGPQPLMRLEEEGFRGYLALPLMGQNDLIGALEIFWKCPQDTRAWDADFLGRLAEQIGLAFARTSTLHELRHRNMELVSRYDAMIEGLSRALELRDLETEGHTRRVSQLTMSLVEHMQIPREQWDDIRQGALLHDIGKLGIPDAILLKPGSLTAQERKVMEQHPLYGYNILASIVHSRQVLDITLYHHERWDGAGYPSGLKTEQIPLIARIFAVADVYDALTSDRPYRSAWSRPQALSHIQGQAGLQFDPKVLEFFMKVVAET
jgi:HD-GYP domain-containing protein (c-di-GMP phosphodiesterase class II)